MAEQHIRRRGNSWTVNLRVNDDKVWESFADRDYGSKAAAHDKAEVFLDQIKAERRNGTYRAPVKVTFRVPASHG